MPRVKSASTKKKTAARRSGSNTQNPWMRAVAETRVSFPNMSLKEAMIYTKSRYVKGQ